MSMDSSPDGFEHEHRRRALFRATALLLGLGIALRLIRYLQNYPLWCDESMLAVNLLGRGWIDLARPLDYRQVCPLGFLSAEWLAVRGLGFTESSLRLFPFLCAAVGVPLFGRLAGAVLGSRSTGAVIAVGLLAVSQEAIRFAGECKPYATDLLVGTVLLFLASRWLQAPGRLARLWALTTYAPVAVFFSLPSLFVLGAIGIVGLAAVLKVRNWGVTAAFVGFVAAAGVSVGVMAALGQYDASPDDRAYFLTFWEGAFPPSWRDPGALLSWLFRTHAKVLFAYPAAANGRVGVANLALFGSFLVGTVVLIRRDPWSAALFLLPFGMTLAASSLRLYPYGMSPRVTQFLVPSTLILAGAGAEWLIGRLRPEGLKRWAVPGVLGALIAFGAWRAAADLTRPYRTPWDRTAREFARWFWVELGAESEMVCVQSDLGIPFDKTWSYDGLDQYLCYQKIYSPAHGKGTPPRWDRVSPTHPLRCVLYNRGPGDVPGFRAWLDANKDRYVLKDVRTYPASRGSAVEPRQVYVVCELLPVIGP